MFRSVANVHLMLQVHTDQSELFVCIYIQELSIHVYKRVYILLKMEGFPCLDHVSVCAPVLKPRNKY